MAFSVLPAVTIGTPRASSAISPSRSGYLSPSNLGFNALLVPALGAVIGDRIFFTAGYAAISLVVTVANLDVAFGYFLNVNEYQPNNLPNQAWVTQIAVGGAASTPALFNIGARGVGNGPGNPIPFDCTTRLLWSIDFANNSDTNDYTVTMRAFCGTE